MTLGSVPRGPSGSSEFLKLNPARRLRTNPLLEEDFQLASHECYREQYAYVVLLANAEGKLCDARIVKARETLNKIASQYRVMIHPQPIRVPSGFWERWRRAKSPQDRLALIKEAELLKDENIFALTCLVLDVDSPYEEAEHVVLELLERLGVVGYELGKSKSGNLRGIIYLKPLRIETGNGENKKVKTFYLTPHGKNRKNGRTHLENAKEVMQIITDYLQAKGLKADGTFTRINHPVWYGKQYYTRVRKTPGENKLYDIYRKAKELQKELRAEEFLKHPKPKKKGTGKVKVPSFIAQAQVQALDDFARWRIAVKKLAEKYTGCRFTKVILPAVGWAMDLNLDRYEVDSYLKELLWDKKDMDKELEKAWKYAKPTTFEWKGSKLKYDMNELVERFLEETEDGANRQYLLVEVFNGQNWLFQLVERFCIREELVSVEKRKLTPGPGRKSHVYILTEKGKSFVGALKDNGLKVSYRQVVGFDTYEDKKSNIKLPPYRGEQSVSIETLGLGVDGKKDDSQVVTSVKGSLTLGKEGRTLEKKEGEVLHSKTSSLWTPPPPSSSTLPEQEKVFRDKNEALSYLDSLNGKYKLGDRVRLLVRSPVLYVRGAVLYEFELTESGWELRTIYWKEPLEERPPVEVEQEGVEEIDKSFRSEQEAISYLNLNLNGKYGVGSRVRTYVPYGDTWEGKPLEFVKTESGWKVAQF